MQATLNRFFLWVWVAVALVLGSGLALIGQSGGMGVALWNVHVMFAIGLLMMAIFGHIYFAPFRRLTRAVAAEDWKSGGAALGAIRTLVGINLVLGLSTIVIALLGRAG